MRLRRCTHCRSWARTYCTQHRQYVCGESECIDAHRGTATFFDFVVVAGKERCDFSPLPPTLTQRFDWIDLLVAGLGLCVAALACAMIVAHYGGAR